MGENNEFREDLYYRINMCPLWIPPLRERRDEIEILFEHFLQQARVTMGKNSVVLDAKLRNFIYHQYDFPGNIRELRNMAQYIACIAEETPVTITDLPERYQRSHLQNTETQQPTFPEPSKHLESVRNDAEREYLIDILKKYHGNIKKICTEMNLSRSRIYQLLNKFKLEAADYR
jgi:DNA-binding NtrC family response regulator